MPEVGRNMESPRVADDQSMAETQLRFEVEGQTAVTMMVIEQPAKSSTSDLQTQVWLANSGGFRQRLQELHDASLALLARRDAQSFQPINHLLCRQE